MNTYGVVDLGAIVGNYLTIGKLARLPVYAVVKSDAYGHGAIHVARALSCVCDKFAVASVEEGAALRVSGVCGEILVLTPFLRADELLSATEYGLTVTVGSEFQLRQMAHERLFPRVHFAINTGMNRFGFRPDRVRRACVFAAENSIAVEGVFSHYYSPEKREILFRQWEIFQEAKGIVKSFFPNALSHIAATGGILADGFEETEGVRAGIGLYGYAPNGFSADGLKPAMKAYATVLGSCSAVGSGRGYAERKNANYATHVLSCGYADGFFRRSFGEKFCMNAATFPGRERAGKEVCLVDDFAEYAREENTIVYEVLCRMSGLEKRYENFTGFQKERPPHPIVGETERI